MGPAGGTRPAWIRPTASSTGWPTRPTTWREWDREHDRHVAGRLLDAVRPDFGVATWRAFERFAIDGLPAARVAEELGVSENAVVRAKSRVLKRLREEAGELLA